MPSDSATNSNKRIVYCYEPGAGETAGFTSLALAVKYGYARDIYLGLWNGGIHQSNGYQDSIVYPIFVVAQYEGGSTSAVGTSRTRWDNVLVDIPQKDTSQIHFSGVSLGGRTLLYMAANVASSSGDPYRFAHSPATMFFASPGGKTTSITNNQIYMKYYVMKGGRVLMATGTNDNAGAYKVDEILPYFNDTLSGSAVGADWVSGVNGFTNDTHCCWDTLYKFDRTYSWTNGMNIYDYQAQFTKTPKAVAQTTINTSGSSVILNGVSNGWYKTIAWSKVGGPSASITSASQDTTAVNLTGGEGTYIFRMTVTNTGDGRTAVHDVTVNVTTPSSGATFIKKRGRKLIIITDP